MCLRMIMTDSSRMMGLSLARSALDSSVIRNKELLLLFATLNNVCVCVCMFVELRILSIVIFRSFHII